MYNACEWGNYCRVQDSGIDSGRQIGRRSIVTYARSRCVRIGCLHRPAARRPPGRGAVLFRHPLSGAPHARGLSAARADQGLQRPEGLALSPGLDDVGRDRGDDADRALYHAGREEGLPHPDRGVLPRHRSRLAQGRRGDLCAVNRAVCQAVRRIDADKRSYLRYFIDYHARTDPEIAALRPGDLRESRIVVVSRRRSRITSSNAPPPGSGAGGCCARPTTRLRWSIASCSRRPTEAIRSWIEAIRRSVPRYGAAPLLGMRGAFDTCRPLLIPSSGAAAYRRTARWIGRACLLCSARQRVERGGEVGRSSDIRLRDRRRRLGRMRAREPAQRRRRVRVVVVEAGGRDRDPMIHIPLGWGKILEERRHDWMYFTEPEPNLDNRSIECARGRVVGGSSSINAMAYVRGHRGDYDRWRQKGCPGGRSPTCCPISSAPNRGRGRRRLPRQRRSVVGAGGDLRRPPAARLHRGGEGGRHDFTEDYNGERQEGFTWIQQTIRNGRRCSAAVAYLKPALKRANVTLETDALVTRLIVENGRAAGLEFARGGNATRSVASAKSCSRAASSTRRRS